MTAPLVRFSVTVSDRQKDVSGARRSTSSQAQERTQERTQEETWRQQQLVKQ